MVGLDLETATWVGFACIVLCLVVIFYTGYQDGMRSHEICEVAGLKYVGSCGPLTNCAEPVKCLNETSHQLEYYVLRKG